MIGLHLSPAIAIVGAGAVTAALAAGPGPSLEGTVPSAAAPEDACSATTAVALSRLQDMIGESLRLAEADVRANGTDGKYAVAATNNRDLLVRSRDRVQTAKSFLQSNSPASTSYAESGKVKEYLRTTIPWLATAAHWATVSASWHRSSDARMSFDRTVAALGEAQKQFGESGRCFMSNYF